jgi:cysteine desulfurase/selenocysteine lyase
MLDCPINEAGTPNVAGGIVLELPSIIWTSWLWKYSKQELELLDYGTKRLLEIEGLKIFGTAKICDFI